MTNGLLLPSGRFAVMSASNESPVTRPHKPKSQIKRERDQALTVTEHSQPPMSAGDSGYHRIRSDIIFGVLTPSGRLKLDSMKEIGRAHV